MFNRKEKQILAPTYKEQQEMKAVIIKELDGIINRWNPRFVIKTQKNTMDKSEELLQKIKNANETISHLFFPRCNSELRTCYDNIMKAIQEINDNVRRSFSDVRLEYAVDKLCSEINTWQNIKDE